MVCTGLIGGSRRGSGQEGRAAPHCPRPSGVPARAALQARAYHELHQVTNMRLIGLDATQRRVAPREDLGYAHYGRWVDYPARWTRQRASSAHGSAGGEAATANSF
eukprot:scaffold50558_cov30-Tisochrysis_lutea.AAC.3